MDRLGACQGWQEEGVGGEEAGQQRGDLAQFALRSRFVDAAAGAAWSPPIINPITVVCRCYNFWMDFLEVSKQTTAQQQPWSMLLQAVAGSKRCLFAPPLEF